jgi:type VII secretion integral membrane protein EccD
MAVTGSGLVRVTVAAPRRRVDIALPENVAVAEMLPILLRHGGEDLADEGVDHGGWALRRTDGGMLSATKTLGSHRVRDGEVLHLVPGRQQWPELDYDDLVDAIASGARRRGRTWTQKHTRWAGLGIGGLALAFGLVVVFRSNSDWPTVGRWALGQAAILLLAGTVLSRAIGDSGAGSIVALLSLPYAFLGTDLIVDPPGVTAEQLQIACAVTAFVALLGYLGIGDDGAMFIAVAVAGLFGLLGSWLTGSHGMPPDHSAAILSSVALLTMPLFNSLSIWLARMPLPVLPRTPADLLKDSRQPPRPAVYAAVARADGLLTGMLTGAAVVSAVANVVVVRDGQLPGQLFVLVVSLCYWLRTRTYVVFRQRLPLLLAAVAGTFGLLLGPALSDPDSQLSTAGPVLLAAGAVMIIVGLAYSRRTPGPYMRRYVEVVEILFILAVLPLGAWVLDLYSKLRGGT